MTNPPSSPLTVAVSLAFSDSAHNSSKFHDTIWAGLSVVVNYGRRGSSGSVVVKTFPTVEQAAAHCWNLLRAKMAKGYHVVGAVTGLDIKHLEPLNDRQAAHAAALWRDRQASAQWRVPEGGEYATRTPRTGRQGAAVLLEISDPTASPETLLAAAIADPSERFLYPLALTHPACPEEAHVAAALMRPTA